MAYPESESPLESKKREYEEKIAALQEILERGHEIDAKFKKADGEYQEIDIILQGLNARIEVLITADKDLSKKVLGSEDEAVWDAWIARNQRINTLHIQIADLYTDRDHALDKIEAIERELDALAREAKEV